MLDVNRLAGPGAGRKVEVKYTLSEGAREKLRAVSKNWAVDMSTLLERLIWDELPAPDAPMPEAPIPQTATKEDFTLD